MGLIDLEEQFDHLPAVEAVARAWREVDPRTHGTWHKHARALVHDQLPLLGRALDRLLAELLEQHRLPNTDPRLWETR